MPGSVAAGGNNRGILAMIAAMACFNITDAMMKLATDTLPPSQIIVLRGLIALVLMFAVMRAAGLLQGFAGLLHPRVLVRMFFEAAFIAVYVIALSRAPFTDVFSILQSGPIMITAFAAIFLREQVGWRRWGAVLFGFLGVLLIIKPTPSTFQPALGLALIAAFMATGRDLSTRFIPPEIRLPMVTFSATLAMTLGGLVLAPFEAWVSPAPLIWLVLAGAAVAVATGSYFVIFAYRSAEASAVAPFRFASVPFAIFLGWMLWGHVPDNLALTGIAIIVTAGLYMMARERAARRVAQGNLPQANLKS